jgi:hypothetical protein
VPFNSDKPQPGGAVGVANGSSHGDFTLSWQEKEPIPDPGKCSAAKNDWNSTPKMFGFLYICVNMC